MSYVDHSAAVPGRGQCGGHEGHEWVEVDRLRDTLRITNEVANGEIARLRAELGEARQGNVYLMQRTHEAEAAIERVRGLGNTAIPKRVEVHSAFVDGWMQSYEQVLSVLGGGTG